MTHEQFCYWLQGFAELSPATPPTPEQWKSIQEHLALTFKKVTPPLPRSGGGGLLEYAGQNPLAAIC